MNLTSLISSGFNALGAFLTHFIQIIIIIVIAVALIVLIRALTMGLNFMQSADDLIRKKMSGENVRFERPSASISRDTFKGGLKIGILLCLLGALTIGTAFGALICLVLAVILFLIYMLLSKTLGDKSGATKMFGNLANRYASDAKEFVSGTKHFAQNMGRVKRDERPNEFYEESYYYSGSDPRCVGDFPDITNAQERRAEELRQEAYGSGMSTQPQPHTQQPHPQSAQPQYQYTQQSAQQQTAQPQYQYTQQPYEQSQPQSQTAQQQSEQPQYQYTQQQPYEQSQQQSYEQPYEQSYEQQSYEQSQQTRQQKIQDIQRVGSKVGRVVLTGLAGLSAAQAAARATMNFEDDSIIDEEVATASNSNSNTTKTASDIKPTSTLDNNTNKTTGITEPLSSNFNVSNDYDFETEDEVKTEETTEEPVHIEAESFDISPAVDATGLSMDFEGDEVDEDFEKEFIEEQELQSESNLQNSSYESTPQPDNHQPDNQQSDNQQPDNHLTDEELSALLGGEIQSPDNQQPDNRQPDNQQSDNRQPDNHLTDEELSALLSDEIQSPDNQVASNYSVEEETTTESVEHQPPIQSTDNQPPIQSTDDNKTTGDSQTTSNQPDYHLTDEELSALLGIPITSDESVQPTTSSQLHSDDKISRVNNYLKTGESLGSEFSECKITCVLGGNFILIDDSGSPYYYASSCNDAPGHLEIYPNKEGFTDIGLQDIKSLFDIESGDCNEVIKPCIILKNETFGFSDLKSRGKIKTINY